MRCEDDETLAVFLPYDPGHDGTHEGIVEVLFPHDQVGRVVAASNALMAAGGTTFVAVLGSRCTRFAAVTRPRRPRKATIR